MQGRFCASKLPVNGAECMCSEKVVLSKFPFFLWNAHFFCRYNPILLHEHWVCLRIGKDIITDFSVCKTVKLISSNSFWDDVHMAKKKRKVISIKIFELNEAWWPTLGGIFNIEPWIIGEINLFQIYLLYFLERTHDDRKLCDWYASLLWVSVVNFRFVLQQSIEEFVNL